MDERIKALNDAGYSVLVEFWSEPDEDGDCAEVTLTSDKVDASSYAYGPTAYIALFRALVKLLPKQ